MFFPSLGGAHIPPFWLIFATFLLYSNISDKLSFWLALPTIGNVKKNQNLIFIFFD